ncbi:uncharacterized protein FRV6_08823 [Fusarium oxysporum]|uniref:Uncharacterized protein n=1 Tax=Fusarium oxysporum TaxID=5507 RepID=A0A2H3TN71_FUSOX|nr:uncharacterized protein FRV6_08823 [Fusarium oxysporum]
MGAPDKRAKAKAAISRYRYGNKYPGRLEHNKYIVMDLAKARYGEQDSPVSKDKISLAATISLTTHFRYREWTAISTQQDLLEEAIYLSQDAAFEDCNWQYFFNTVQKSDAQLGRMVLLEVTYEFWRRQTSDLVREIQSLSELLETGEAPLAQPADDTSVELQGAEETPLPSERPSDDTPVELREAKGAPLMQSANDAPIGLHEVTRLSPAPERRAADWQATVLHPAQPVSGEISKDILGKSLVQTCREWFQGNYAKLAYIEALIEQTSRDHIVDIQYYINEKSRAPETTSIDEILCRP